MSPPTLYVAITNHGYGHATRAAAVAATVKALLPEVRLILATTAPSWLLADYLGDLNNDYVLRRHALDIGVVQHDSFRMDREATLAQLTQIYDQRAATVAAEAAFLQAEGVDLVLADIPPLATALAHAAEVPCWMMSNFGWDFIYRDWGPDFAPAVAWIEQCFAACDRLFRLPFHEPMAAFPTVQDVGLTGGTHRYDPAALAARLGITAPRERTVLLTFGGLGLADVPYATVERYPHWQFLTFDQPPQSWPNLTVFPRQGIRPVDVMPLCGRVFSKPGYSTYAEACLYDVPIMSITRDNFAEGPMLIDQLRTYVPHQVLTPAQFFQGDWSGLDQPMVPPRRPNALSKQGNQQIADEIVAYLSRS